MKLSRFLIVSSVVTGLILLGYKIFTKPFSIRHIEGDDTSFDEESIRELAEQIWESEGKPEGQAARHWAMAIELLKSSRAEGNYRDAGHRNTKSTADSNDPYAYADKKSLH